MERESGLPELRDHNDLQREFNAIRHELAQQNAAILKYRQNVEQMEEALVASIKDLRQRIQEMKNTQSRLTSFNLADYAKDQQVHNWIDVRHHTLETIAREQQHMAGLVAGAFAALRHRVQLLRASLEHEITTRRNLRPTRPELALIIPNLERMLEQTNTAADFVNFLEFIPIDRTAQDIGHEVDQRVIEALKQTKDVAHQKFMAGLHERQLEPRLLTHNTAEAKKLYDQMLAKIHEAEHRKTALGKADPNKDATMQRLRKEVAALFATFNKILAVYEDNERDHPLVNKLQGDPAGLHTLAAMRALLKLKHDISAAMKVFNY